MEGDHYCMDLLLKCLIGVLMVLPLTSRLILIARYRSLMAEVLCENENDRDGHRSLILAFAGFSFAGVVGLVVLEPVNVDVKYPVYYFIGSFLAYFWAFNLEGYKAKRWEDNLSAGLRDVGSLCLILGLSTLLFSRQYDFWFIALASWLAIMGWIVDCVVRFSIDWRYMREWEQRMMKGNHV